MFVYWNKSVESVKRALDKCDQSGLFRKENGKLPVYCKGKVFLGELNKSAEAPHGCY